MTVLPLNSSINPFSFAENYMYTNVYLQAHKTHKPVHYFNIFSKLMETYFQASVAL